MASFPLKNAHFSTMGGAKNLKLGGNVWARARAQGSTFCVGPMLTFYSVVVCVKKT